MNLSDVGVSVRMRDVIATIAATTVEKMRPEEKIGKVYSFDVNTQVAKIYLPGEGIDSLLDARFAKDKIPTVEMITTFAVNGYEAEGNIVRIAGGPGSYYILDYISGIPAIDPSARALVAQNTVLLNENIDAIEGVSGDISALEADLENLNTVVIPALNADLTTLETVTIPALQADLGDTNLELDALVSVTIPALNTSLTTAQAEIDAAEADITALESTTSTLTSDLASNTTAISTLNGKFPIVSTDITDGAITTPKMTANAINGDRITANTLNASKIIANTISGDRIMANAIDVTKLTIGDMQNYIADGDLSDSTFTNWSNTGLTRVAPVGTTPAYMEWSTNAGVNAHRYNLYEFELQPGDEFYFSCEISTPASNTDGINVSASIEVKDATGTNLAWPAVTDNIFPDEPWTAVAGTITIPAGNGVKGRFSPFTQAVGGSGGQILRMRRMFLRKKNAGNLIVDGAITTSKILSGSIVTSHITTNTLHGSVIVSNTMNATKITAGSIGTDRMTANTINGDRITANTLNATKIVAGSIGTDTMTANTINGDRITINTLNGDKIIANTITATHLTATAIDGKTITGSLFRTAASGKRMELNSDPGDASKVVFYTGSGSEIQPSTLAATASGQVVWNSARMAAGQAGFFALGPNFITLQNSTSGGMINLNAGTGIDDLSLQQGSNPSVNMSASNNMSLYATGYTSVGASSAVYIDIGSAGWTFDSAHSLGTLYTSFENAAGATRMYQWNINRSMYIIGDGIYSTENMTTGCPFYGSFIAWSDKQDKSSLKPFGKAVVNKDASASKRAAAPSALESVRGLPVFDYDTPHGGAGKTILDEEGKPVLDKDGNPKKTPSTLVRKRGVMAQDLQAVAPHLIHDETDDPNTGFGLGVDLYGLLATTLAALQELDDKVTQLEGSTP